MDRILKITWNANEPAKQNFYFQLKYKHDLFLNHILLIRATS